MLNALQQHQIEFTRALLQQTDKDLSFIRKINSSPRIPPQIAIEIYRNNTRGARTSALEQIYPVCKKILGADIFRSIARQYVNADTNGSLNLNVYGNNFYQYLKMLLADRRLAEDYRYLSDLARLEYMFHAASYADNDSDFDFALFAEKVQCKKPVYFKVSASLGLIESIFPVCEIWLNNDKQQNVESVRAIKGPQYIAVHRKIFKPVVRSINKDEYRLLKAFYSGLSLQEVIEKSALNIDSILPKFIAKKWIVGIKHEKQG